MEYKTDAVLDIQGNAVFNASIRALTKSRQLATVFNASGVQIPNPVSTDKTGEYSLALPNGEYYLEVSFNGTVYETKGPVTFFDPKDSGLFSVEDYPSYQAAYDEASPGQEISILDTSGVPGTVSGTKQVLWRVNGDTLDNPSLLELPGLVESQHGKARMLYQASAGPQDFATSRITRNANYSGGTPGFVNSAHRVSTVAGTGSTSFEWNLLATLTNNSNAGENVAFYGQAKGYGLGPTWAGVLEVRDEMKTGARTIVGLELDVVAYGTDTGNSRVGIDVVGFKNDAQDAVDAEFYAGVRVVASYNPTTAGLQSARFKRPFYADVNWTDAAYTAIKRGALAATVGTQVKYFRGVTPVGASSDSVEILEERVAGTGDITTTDVAIRRVVDGTEINRISFKGVDRAIEFYGSPGEIIFRAVRNIGAVSFVETVPTASTLGPTIRPGGAAADINFRIAGKGTGGPILGNAGEKIAFYGVAPVARPAITGSRGGNAALADLLAKLVTLGLITDSTTA